MWITLVPTKHIVSLIGIFKEVVLHTTKLSSSFPEETKYSIFFTFLGMLRKIYIVNENIDNADIKKIRHEEFYIPELSDAVNIQQDYLNWLQDIPNREFRLFHYSFVFDANAKSLLMETDQLYELVLTSVTTEDEDTWDLDADPDFLAFEVHRDNLLQDAIAELSRITSIDIPNRDLKKPLKVKFIGEEAYDAGGVKNEFFTLVLREIGHSKYGLFTELEGTGTLWFLESSPKDNENYYYIGLLCGLAIYYFNMANLRFPLVIYKKILTEPILLEDLVDLCPTLVKSLKHILEYEKEDFEDQFGLTFEVSTTLLGPMVMAELKPDGKNINVTLENKQEYVDLYVDFLLNRSVEKKFDAFNLGFHRMCGSRILHLFKSYELKNLFGGIEIMDWGALKENTQYWGGFSADHPTILMFWKVFDELTLEQKKSFLFFLTASDRMPYYGTGVIKIIIQQTRGGDSFLPVAHTCHKMLDLPEYKTEEKLRSQLLLAIEHTLGFALV